MGKTCIVCLALLVGACSSHRVNCDGPLQPINAPAAVQKPPVRVAVQPAARPTERKP